MSNLSVIEVNGQNVVDSRLVADELGIEHKNFLATVRKYEADVMEFGHLAFETRTVTNSVGAINREVFCYLNEEQATFVMTLSKNTERVRQCKKNLVKAFSEARKVIKSQGDRIRELELEIELRKTEQKLLDTRNIIVQTCPEPVQQKILGYQVVEKVEYRDRVLLDDQLIRDGSTLTKKQLCDRYGFKTRNGAPDYRRLKLFLNNANLPSEAWKMSMAILENHELNREYLGLLDARFNNGGDRQMFLGE